MFDDADYRSIVRRRVAAAKKLDRTMTFQKLAEATGIPKSYVSRVMKGGADFSGDQLFKISRFLELTPLEIDYLQLLLEHERSQSHLRKAYLGKKVEAFRLAQLEARRHLRSREIDPGREGMAEYYYQPLNQIVHIALSIPRYQHDPARLADDLGITTAQLRQTLATLERLGIISRGKGERIKVEVWDIHLPRDASVYHTWRDQVRLLSLGRLKQLGQESAYSFSVTFSASEAVRVEVQARFMELLEAVKPSVDAAKDEECYQLNFDLFRWTSQ